MNFTPLLHQIFSPGHSIGCIAGQDITLGQFVAISGGGSGHNPGVQVAAAGARAFGLAQENASAGDIVGIQRGNGRCFEVPTTATILAGQDIEVGTNGEPVPHTTGVVVAQAINNSADGHVDLTLI